MKVLGNAIDWFEIPATNLARAKKFYEGILGVKLQEMLLNNNLKMALFPVTAGSVGGALCEHKEFYQPGHSGSLVYLNADPDLQLVLDKIPSMGGKIIKPKTAISPDHGFMALFEDTEGNRVALHSKG